MLSSNIKTGAFYLSLTINDRRIDRLFAERGAPPATPYLAPYPGSLKLGAVQLQLRPSKNLRDYVAQMEEGVAKGVAAGAHVICYPQYCGLLPLTLLPRLDRVIEELQQLEADERNYRDAFHLILESLSDFMLSTYAAVFSNLARYYQVYIMAGSTYVYEEGRITHRAYLFDPAGEIVGSQEKLALAPFEESFGVNKGSDLTLFHTSLGDLSILFEEDLQLFETTKIASHLGARIILTPGGQATVAEPANREEHRRLWPVLRAQEQGVFIVRSSLVGQLGLTFTGETGIYAPWAITKEKDGRWATVTDPNQSGVAVSRTDLARLAEGVDLLAADQNENFYRKELLPRYERRVGPLPVLDLRPQRRSPSSEILLELLDKMPLSPTVQEEEPLRESARLTAVEEFTQDIETAIRQEREDIIEQDPLEQLLHSDLILDEILREEREK